jgi:hypothetical protein
MILWGTPTSTEFKNFKIWYPAILVPNEYVSKSRLAGLLSVLTSGLGVQAVNLHQ